MPYREDAPELAGRRRGAHLPLLERVTVATPCPVAWDDMVGDERVRHCRHCDQQVFDTAAMTTAEVEALIAQVRAGARVCGRLHRRPDGTLITRDCADARRARLRAARRLVAMSAVSAAAIAVLVHALPRGAGAPPAVDVPPAPPATARAALAIAMPTATDGDGGATALPPVEGCPAADRWCEVRARRAAPPPPHRHRPAGDAGALAASLFRPTGLDAAAAEVISGHIVAPDPVAPGDD